jgi:16S rRNA (guanine527-N7)-methyltransferase
LTDERFEQTLLQGAESLGIEISDGALERLHAHRRLLLRWAKRINLTTVLDPEGMAERLYLDSAVLLPHLRPGARLHDVGSGAGFPGLILKALMPDLDVTLTEARQKKVSFLRQAAREMGITDGLQVRCRRVGQDEVDDESWEEVVSRAAFPVETWLEQGRLLVAPGGRLWIFAGPAHETEETSPPVEVPAGFGIGDRITYRLVKAGLDRWLLGLRRDG